MGQQQIESPAGDPGVMRTLEVDATCARYYRDAAEMPQAEEASVRSRAAFDAVAELAEAAIEFARGMPLDPRDNARIIGNCNSNALERLRAAAAPFRGQQA